MKKKRFLGIMVLALVGLLFVAACDPSTSQTLPEEPGKVAEAEEKHADEDEHDDSEAEAEGHADDDAHGDDEHEDDDHSHVDPPHEFAEMTNPFSDDSDAIAAGQAIFEANCAACHGSTGEGDGPAAANLDPQPASLADAEMMGDVTDGYLFWRISEGGAMEPFNSAMPVWKETLSEEEIWQVVNYVRALSE